MKILVFTSKYIGLDLLDVLFSRFNKDDYMFIVSEPNSKNIIESIEKHGHNYKLLNDATLNWLNEKEIESFDWLLSRYDRYIFFERIILFKLNGIFCRRFQLKFSKKLQQ